MIEHLTEGTFTLFAAKHYDNAQCCDTEEFYDDLKRFKYLKRLFGKYVETGDLKERLILNHIVILFNVFNDQTSRMLFFKLENYYSYLKPFLVLLNQMPDSVLTPEGKIIYSSDIEMDQNIVSTLRGI